MSAGLQVSGAQFTLVTGSALLVGASYQGVAQVPTAGGKAVPMMEFTMNSMTPLVPLKLTNVTTSQPYISSSSLQLPGLQVAS